MESKPEPPNDSSVKPDTLPKEKKKKQKKVRIKKDIPTFKILHGTFPVKFD